MSINLLTTLFAIVTVVIVVAALFRWRRVPTIRLMRAAERRIATHRDALAGLQSVMADAHRRGERQLFDQLARNAAKHRSALLALDPKTAGKLPPLPRWDERA